jgi:O-antigen/teichoic acid export membrane protein
MELGWLIGGQVLSIAGALAAVRCLTEALPPEMYGVLGLGMTAATAIQQLWFGPLCATTDRFFPPAREAGQLGVFFRVLLRLLTLTGAPLLLILSALSVSLLYFGFGDWGVLLACAAGYAIASGANNLLESVQNASRCRHLVALHNGASAWLRLMLAVGLVWVYGPSASVVLVGYIGGSALVLVSQYASFRRVIQAPSHSIDNSTTKSSSAWQDLMWGFLWPALSWGAFTWAFAASDRWFLQVFSSTESVGRYLVLYQLGYYPVSLLAGLVQQWVYPILFAQAGDGTNPLHNQQVIQSTRKWLVLTAVAVVAAVLCASIAHGLVFQCLAAAKYREVSPWLPGMVLASGLFALGQLATLPLVATVGTRSLARCKIGSSCLGLLLNGIGAWQGGVAGLVVAQICFSATYVLWTLLLLAQASRQQRSSVELSESASAERQAA